jgi:hypothetical protein
MKLPYYLLLTGATLLTACSDKEEKVVAPEIDFSAPVARPGYVTYNQDGKVVTYRAVAFRRGALPGSGVNQYMEHILQIQMLDSVSGAELPFAYIRYEKAPGASDAEFKGTNLSVPNYLYYDLLASTLVKTSRGWSGTFSGNFTPWNTPITYKVRSGTFTDIQE